MLLNMTQNLETASHIQLYIHICPTYFSQYCHCSLFFQVATHYSSRGISLVVDTQSTGRKKYISSMDLNPGHLVQRRACYQFNNSNCFTFKVTALLFRNQSDRRKSPTAWISSYWLLTVYKQASGNRVNKLDLTNQVAPYSSNIRYKTRIYLSIQVVDTYRFRQVKRLSSQ